MAPATKLQDLPDSLLDLIALAVDSQERRRVLPVLSKRWAGLLQGPGPAWAAMNISDEDFTDWAYPDARMVAAWFSRRPGSVRVLSVTPYNRSMATSLLRTVLMSQAASLCDLRLDCASAALHSTDLAVLTALTGLESLTLSLKEPGVAAWDDHAAEVIGTLSQLPALKSLEILGGWTTADKTKPTLSQLAALRSPTLTQMNVAMTTAVAGTLVLSALPALESCELLWRIRKRGSHLQLRVTAASFSNATALTQLTLTPYDHLQLAPDCFSSLVLLSGLSLTRCQLTAVPAALAGVQHTLRRLDLSFNELRLTPHCFDSLIVLEELALVDCGLREVPVALAGVQRSLRRLDLSDNHYLCLERAGYDALLALSALESLRMERKYTLWHRRGLMTQYLADWHELNPGLPLPLLAYAAGL